MSRDTSHRRIRERCGFCGFTGSMGRRGDPCDNAAAECLMKTLKVEAVYVAGHETFEDVYNEIHLHSALDYLSSARYGEANQPAPVKTTA